MKKFIAMLLAVIMVLSLVACGTPAPTEPAPTDPAPTNPATPTDPAPTDPAPTDPTDPVVVNPYAAYYQTFQSEDQGTANYWDDKGSVAGDLHSYFAGGFWGNAMNEEKDGYDWICELANEKPVAVNPDENGLATIYKFEVKVGSQLKYNTLSTKPEFAAFAGREVALEDYLTPWKELYNQSNGIARGPEGATGGSGSIKGITEYYNGTAQGFDEELWNQVGIKATMEDGKAYLAREGMEANLGAIAKGYIADKVKELLLDQGVESAIIDLGRNVLLIGTKPDGSNFNVGVQDPNEAQGVLLGLASTADTSVVTSGINERYFTYEGVDYHHILDPKTGYACDTDLTSATIIADSSMQADAFSTICILLGLEKATELIEKEDGVEAIFIDNTDEIHYTSGLSLNNNEFTLK